MKRLLLFYIGFLLFVSCATVGVTVIKSYPPKDSNSPLDIYTSKDDIKRPYEVICLLDSQTGTTAFSDKTAAAAIENSKAAARKCGADAILVESVDRQGATYASWGSGKAIIKGIKYLP